MENFVLLYMACLCIVYVFTTFTRKKYEGVTTLVLNGLTNLKMVVLVKRMDEKWLQIR